MDDMAFCPICHKKLIVEKTTFINNVETEKPCIKKKCNGPHYFIFYANPDTHQIEFIKMSMDNYNVFLEINYVNSCSKILRYNNSNVVQELSVDRILDLDFNNLESIKEKINLYICFG